MPFLTRGFSLELTGTGTAYAMSGAALLTVSDGPRERKTFSCSPERAAFVARLAFLTNDCFAGSTPGANGSAALASGVQYRRLIKSLDPSRAITSAYDWHDPGIADAWATQVTDVFGINYNSQRYDEVHAKHPKLPIIGSEDCNAKTDRSVVANASE